MVKTEQKSQTMYNLDIANLDNFYVGEQGWLVHNNDGCKILFGQKRISERFNMYSDYPLVRGRTIGEVAADIKAGIISPNDIPIQYFEYNGQLVTINNRGLAALAEAGVNPTNLIKVATGDVPQDVLAKLLESPVLRGQTLPSSTIPITLNKDGTGLIRVVNLPE